MHSSLPRVWFITGCSSGLGLALARHALALGERVVVSARQVEKAIKSVAAAEQERAAWEAVGLPTDFTNSIAQ